MHSLDDFMEQLNYHLRHDIPLEGKFEMAELVQPNIVILLPPPNKVAHE